MTREQIISAIETFAAEAKLAGATVTSRSVGNSRLYDRLKSGGDCTTETAAKVLAFIEASRAAKGAGQ